MCVFLLIKLNIFKKHKLYLCNFVFKKRFGTDWSNIVEVEN